jgi:MFS family permease
MESSSNKKIFNKIDDARTKEALYYSIIDGILWALMFGVSENFIIPFALLFNASVFQVSAITGCSQLGIGVGQLIGAKFINNHPSLRKRISIIGNTVHAFSWLLIISITVLTKNVYLIILLYFFSVFSSSFGGPGWLSWMNDIVPEKLRGQFWGFRNRILGFSQFGAIAFAGIFLFYMKNNNTEIPAYIILFIMGFLFRVSSIYPLNKQYAPPMNVPKKENLFKFKIFLTKLIPTNFGRFSLFCFFMTFTVNFMGPLIPVFIFKDLGYNYIQYTVVMMIASIFSFLFMTYWGPLTDKYGNQRILFITALVLPLFPLGWIFFRNFYLLCIMQMLSGFVWAGFNLSSVNYIFDAVRKENISKIMAYFNSLNNLFAFFGAISGGLLASLIDVLKINYTFFNKFVIVFFISTILRIVVLIIFRDKFKEVRDVEKSPSIRYFYIYKPVNDMIDRLQFINDRFMKRKKSKN